LIFQIKKMIIKKLKSMSKKNIIIIISLGFLILFIIFFGYFIYYLISNSRQNNSVAPAINIADQEFRAHQMAETEADYNKQFPDVITGVINIVSDKKTTIKLENGVEYLISPARPKLFFKDSGINNGVNVKARGKIMDNNLFSLGSVINSK